MRNFQRKFLEKGDQVGYMYSIHDDKKHLHAHIYLIPFSKKGQYISMNAPKYFRGKDIKNSAVKVKRNPTKNSKAIWMKEHNSNLFKSLVRDYSKSNTSIFKGFFLDDSLTFGKRKKDLDLER